MKWLTLKAVVRVQFIGEKPNHLGTKCIAMFYEKIAIFCRVQCGNTDTIDFSGNESQNTPNFHKVTRGTMEVVC